MRFSAIQKSEKNMTSSGNGLKEALIQVRPTAPTPGRVGGGGPNFGGADNLGDIFEDIFGMSGGLGGFTQRGRRPARRTHTVSQDLHYSMEVDFLQAALGGQAKISIQRDGKIERINVKIPSGVDEGSKIRLTGKGGASPRGPKGDLYITIHVKPHPYFRREGEDILVDIPVSLTEAALGAKIKVPTLDGNVTLTIPAGTASGNHLRLQGKGAKQKKGKRRGDQYAIIKIVPPKKLNKKAHDLLEELQEHLTEDPRQGKF